MMLADVELALSIGDIAIAFMNSVYYFYSFLMVEFISIDMYEVITERCRTAALIGSNPFSLYGEDLSAESEKKREVEKDCQIDGYDEYGNGGMVRLVITIVTMKEM